MSNGLLLEYFSWKFISWNAQLTPYPRKGFRNVTTAFKTTFAFKTKTFITKEKRFQHPLFISTWNFSLKTKLLNRNWIGRRNLNWNASHSHKKSYSCFSISIKPKKTLKTWLEFSKLSFNIISHINDFKTKKIYIRNTK